MVQFCRVLCGVLVFGAVSLYALPEDVVENPDNGRQNPNNVRALVWAKEEGVPDYVWMGGRHNLPLHPRAVELFLKGGGPARAIVIEPAEIMN